MDDLDRRIAEAMHRAAPPTEVAPHEVLAQIHERVPAVADLEGLGAGTPRTWRTFGMFALPVAAFVVALVLGAMGAFGGGDDAGDGGSSEGLVVSPSAAVEGYDCPEGSAIGELRADDRVVATGRTDDGTWIQVRDPSDVGRLLWVRSMELRPIDGAASFDDLPVVACDSVAGVPLADGAFVGQVRDVRSGEGIGDVRVVVTSIAEGEAALGSVITEPDGTYSLEGFDEEEYGLRVEAEDAGYESGWVGAERSPNGWRVVATFADAVSWSPEAHDIALAPLDDPLDSAPEPKDEDEVDEPGDDPPGTTTTVPVGVTPRPTLPANPGGTLPPSPTTIPTPSPTTPPIAIPPTIGALTSNQQEVFHTVSCSPNRATLSVNVTAFAPLASVTATWRYTGGGTPHTGTIDLSGPAAGGTWQGQFGPNVPQPIGSGNALQVEIRAVDQQGRQSVRTFSGVLTVQICLF